MHWWQEHVWKPQSLSQKWQHKRNGIRKNILLLYHGECPPKPRCIGRQSRARRGLRGQWVQQPRSYIGSTPSKRGPLDSGGWPAWPWWETCLRAPSGRWAWPIGPGPWWGALLAAVFDWNHRRVALDWPLLEWRYLESRRNLHLERFHWDHLENWKKVSIRILFYCGLVKIVINHGILFEGLRKIDRFTTFLNEEIYFYERYRIGVVLVIFLELKLRLWLGPKWVFVQKKPCTILRRDDRITSYFYGKVKSPKLLWEKEVIIFLQIRECQAKNIISNTKLISQNCCTSRTTTSYLLPSPTQLLKCYLPKNS